MSKERKTITVKEFRELGLLQEINRIVLHPLGLALAVELDDETGEESIVEVWDSRDDPEGFIYDLANSDQDRIKAFQRKRDKVNELRDALRKTRWDKLGYIIEPIPNVKCHKCEQTLKETREYQNKFWCENCFLHNNDIGMIWKE